MEIRLGELLAVAAETLADLGPESSAEASRIIAHVSGLTRSQVLAYAERPISAVTAADVHAFAQRRALGEPLAYIFGESWFYGRCFHVTDAVLVPRPETEHLVDEVIRRCSQAQTICDVGTGSGAIALSLACELPQAKLTAVDISAAALAIAAQNATRLGVAERVAFVQSDLMGSVGASGSAEQSSAAEQSGFDVIIANLPYIPSAAVPQKPDPVGFEPVLALDGGSDGLALYAQLLMQLPVFMRPDTVLLFEAAPPTIRALCGLTQQTLPAGRAIIHRDYAGLERYIIWTTER